jgi:2-polyprenyl-3-methyl-5-hydroxy-6-metoxy-1,4-benzoquinol methylase
MKQVRLLGNKLTALFTFLTLEMRKKANDKEKFMHTEFLELCDKYLLQLRAADSFESILKLWRENTFPYHISNRDPFSNAYREEVLDVYRRLTRSDYLAENELTSTKQSAEDFAIGYPWVSKHLDVVAQEMAKTVQALKALSVEPIRRQSIVEFGCGWGNLAVPLARAGQQVTVVDIDEAFLNRVRDHVERDGFAISTEKGDFVEAAARLEGQFDAVVFQSSFHHCIDFHELLEIIGQKVLNEEGRIFFFSEPIYKNFAFPWGLRFDGESIWAIMCNKWLELGFDEGFFLQLMHNHGFLMKRVDGVPGYVGEGWVGNRARQGLWFSEWVLPDGFDDGFWPEQGNRLHGRFLRGRATLPRIWNQPRAAYRLSLKNFGACDLKISLCGDSQIPVEVDIPAGAEKTVGAPISSQSNLVMNSQTFIPNELIANGDMRRIGVALIHVSFNVVAD